MTLIQRVQSSINWFRDMRSQLILVDVQDIFLMYKNVRYTLFLIVTWFQVFNLIIFLSNYIKFLSNDLQFFINSEQTINDIYTISEHYIIFDHWTSIVVCGSSILLASSLSLVSQINVKTNFHSHGEHAITEQKKKTQLNGWLIFIFSNPTIKY